MRKVDLHVHTVSNPFSDGKFDFNLEVLKKYVEKMNIECIAITNHNIFDKEQFREIENKLDILVLPGVEIDIGAGHLLLIGDKDSVEEIEVGSLAIKSLLEQEERKKRHISFEEYSEIFKNNDRYLLIPHYTKKPRMHQECFEKFGDSIFCGEVQGHKSFITMKKDSKQNITPVYFSDFRASSDKPIAEDNFSFPVRYTYLDIDELSFKSIKGALMDKEKVFLNSSKENGKFEISYNQTVASDKLNLIIGKRSSGKTQLLREIEASNYGSVFFIKQFQITSASKPDQFKNELITKYDNFTENYYEPLKRSINDIMKIDEEVVLNKLNDYLDSLKEYAYDRHLNDVYSAMPIFKEQNFMENNPTKLKALVKNIEQVHKNIEYKSIINRYIDDENLFKLLEELIVLYKFNKHQFIIKTEVDKIIESTKILLSKVSSKKPIKSIDLRDTFTIIKKIDLFNKKILLISNDDKLIKKEVNGKFVTKISKSIYENATSMKNELRTGCAVSNVMKKHYLINPYKFLRGLKESGIEEGKLYKSLFRIDYKVFNEKETEVSGGETAEFNLLNQIEEASKYEILLMDEPEASFDNEFINTEIIPLIKKISQTTTIFIVTHNNTMGTLLKPNNVIFTYFDMEEYKKTNKKEACFKTFYGKFTDSILKNSVGEETSNYKALLTTMEAGVKAYTERRIVYENLKD